MFGLFRMDSYLVTVYKDTDRKLREQRQPTYHTVKSQNVSDLQQFLKKGFANEF